MGTIKRWRYTDHWHMSLSQLEDTVSSITKNTLSMAVTSMGFAEADIANMKDGFKDINPIKRTGTPDEMGGIAAFLASSESSFIIGEEIVADGGVVNL
jgi:NAD(P)-dependent dehydrogenase (short-subunit alcohol dehydrogenase family)